MTTMYLGVTTLVFYKNWQGIGGEMDIPDRGFTDTLSIFVKH